MLTRGNKLSAKLKPPQTTDSEAFSEHKPIKCPANTELLGNRQPVTEHMNRTLILVNPKTKF